MPDGAAADGAARRERLAARRKALGLTQEDLAHLLAVDRTTVARWEGGGSEPAPWIRPKLARVLKVPPGQLGELLVARQPGRDGTAPVVPRQLPPAVGGFTGRAAELDALTRLLDQAGAGSPGMVVISAIGGTAGVGKTALAVQWAHQVAGHFPDGQLYVNLRGYDPDQPMPASDALAGFLRSLGVASQDIPAEQEERAGRYRTLLADRRVLIVLDNAGSVEQVRSLLPGSPSCAVVVTSRDALAGLVARHGAARLELDLLPLAEAVGLLRALIGQRAEDDPDAVAMLAAQCCRLPLALRVAAEMATARPDIPIAGLAAELADQQRLLDLLDADGDPRTAVRAVLSWSYRHLGPGTARAFRLAGLHPAADFDLYAVAALTGTGLGHAHTVLDALARAHLVQPVGAKRYGMHDLLRAYARELAGTDDGEAGQNAALTRLFDHYLRVATMAIDVLYPAERHRRPGIPPPDTLDPRITEPAAARDWLDAERATLAAVTVHAAGHGWPACATGLSATLFRYLDVGGYYPEALTIHSHARAAAERAGDRAAEAAALNCLGAVHMRQSRYQQAADHAQQALALFRQAGDRAGQARALGNLGVIRYCQGRYQEAAGYYRQTLDLFHQVGARDNTARSMYNLGVCEERLGRYDAAARHYRDALTLAADIGASHTSCSALKGLGGVGIRQSRYRQAADHLDQALAMSREIGYRDAEADALNGIGDLCLRQGHHDEAVGHLLEALSLYREIGKPSGEAQVLNSLGEVFLAASQPGNARVQHAAALRLARQAGDRYEQACAHYGLGQACQADGNPSRARRHWQQALALFTDLGTPEAGQVRAHLAAAQDGSAPKPQASR